MADPERPDNIANQTNTTPDASTDRDTRAALASAERITVPLEQLQTASWNARRYFDSDALADLSENLKANGQVTPIIVRRMGARNSYQVIAGERRTRAAQLAGLEKLDALCVEANEVQARRIALVENLERENLSVFEEAIGLLELLAHEFQGAPGWDSTVMHHGDGDQLNAAEWVVREMNRSHPEVSTLAMRWLQQTEAEVREIVDGAFARRSGLTLSSFVRYRLPVLRWPEEVREALQRGDISYKKAALVRSVSNDDQRQALLDRVLESNLTRDQIADEIEVLRYARPEQKEAHDQVQEAMRETLRKFRTHRTRLTDLERKRAQGYIEKIGKLLEKAEGRAA